MRRSTQRTRRASGPLRTVLAALAAAIPLLLPAACQAPSADGDEAGAAVSGQEAGGVKEVVVSAEQGLPFSPAVRASGPLLFLSGQVGTRPGTTELVEGGIGPETRQTMENIRATLEEAGASMDDVVKCTAFIDDVSEWGAMNEVYREFFPGEPPARSALGADGLALGAAVEIECIAVAPAGGM